MLAQKSIDTLINEINKNLKNKKSTFGQDFKKLTYRDTRSK